MGKMTSGEEAALYSFSSALRNNVTVFQGDRFTAGGSGGGGGAGRCDWHSWLFISQLPEVVQLLWYIWPAFNGHISSLIISKIKQSD